MHTPHLATINWFQLPHRSPSFISKLEGWWKLVGGSGVGYQ